MTSQPSSLTPVFDANLARAKAEVFVSDQPFRLKDHKNMAGENPGSRALLAYAWIKRLTAGQTLELFGEYLREVLNNPEGTDHPNIRALLRYLPKSQPNITWHGNNPFSITCIEQSWEHRASEEALQAPGLRYAVGQALHFLDRGRLRVAEPDGNGGWRVNQWLKQAVLLSFRLNDNQVIDGGAAGAPAFDKVPTKFDGWSEQRFRNAGFRVVPGAVVRHGSYIAKGVVLMPSFVNIGAYVDEGTMVDTWATVGSCAQIGKNVHISGGAGIGGVLEPIQAAPVIIGDGAFIGARSEVAEGVRVGEGAVLSMGVYLGASTKIIDRETGTVYMGEVPPYAVVVPGSLPAPNGGPSLYCAVIVKTVDAQTRAKTGINELLRD